MTSRQLLVRASCSAIGLVALAATAQAAPEAPKAEGQRPRMGEHRAAGDAKGRELTKGKPDKGDETLGHRGPKEDKPPTGAPSASGGPLPAPSGSVGPDGGPHHEAGPDEHQRHERRLSQLGELRGRWGQDVLKTPPAREELQHHAWRLARLKRMRELATEKKNDKLLLKLDKLDQKENERHEKAMTRLKSGAAVASPESSALPAPSVPSAGRSHAPAANKKGHEGGKP